MTVVNLISKEGFRLEEDITIFREVAIEDCDIHKLRYIRMAMEGLKERASDDYYH
jgi:hypothetical protein